MSCIIAGIIYSFSVIYYRGEKVFFTTIGVLIGIIVVRLGICIAFGRRSQEAFSRANRDIATFVASLIDSMKQSTSNEKDIIHCTYVDEKGRNKTLKVKFLNTIACFLLSGQSDPIFVHHNNVFFVELKDETDFLTVSISIEHHEWLEVECKREDFKKYQAWKES